MPLNMKRQVPPLLAILLSFSLAAAPQAEIEQMVHSEDLVINGVEILTQAIILEIYRENGFKPYWTEDRDIRELLDLIEAAPDHGLLPGDYNLSQLRRIWSGRKRNPAAGSAPGDDILLTESMLRYGYHRRFGKIKASSMDPNINFKREAFRNQPPGKTLYEILSAPSLQPFIDMAAPSGPYYQRLQHLLAHYRGLADAGGWRTVPAGPTLREGDAGPRVARIRARLAVSGDLGATADRESEKFDKELAWAVKAFQTRHGLEADGIVGKQTISAMNVPVEERIDQLRVSLERLRWVKQEDTGTLVAVNIAAYRAFFFRDGELEWVTRAMVGKTYRRTPVFRGDMTYLEFNPTWTIPPGILRNDTLPAIKRDPNYLASKNIRVIDRNGKFVDPQTVDWNRYSKGVPYTLRQDPGPNNSLGTVKFIFPNEHFVFLHDTPHRELFDRPERAFSSGCIRIEDPLKLAELILDDPGRYSRSDLEAVVASRKTQRIVLDESMPVLITYLTASLDMNGNAMFFKDIYGRDRRVLAALNGPVVIDPPKPGGGR